MTRPTIPDVLPLVRAYLAKEGNICGGSLHIVLEDGNVADCDVTFCIEWAREHGDPEGEKLGQLLLTMSRTQRLKIRRLRFS